MTKSIAEMDVSGEDSNGHLGFGIWQTGPRRSGKGGQVSDEGGPAERRHNFPLFFFFSGGLSRMTPRSPNSHSGKMGPSTTAAGQREHPIRRKRREHVCAREGWDGGVTGPWPPARIRVHSVFHTVTVNLETLKLVAEPNVVLLVHAIRRTGLFYFL